MQGMHTGVRPTRPAHCSGGAGQLLEGVFKTCLNGGTLRLALPAMKVGSIIGQCQSNISHGTTILPRLEQVAGF
jgi:hypothetical protein